MNEQKNDKEIDINKLMIRVYNKIAIWNNQDISAEEKTITLKVLSHDIITDIITTAFSQLKEVKVKEKIIAGENKKKGFFDKLLKK